MVDRGGEGERGIGLKKAGSTDKGLFGLGTPSAACWGWVKEVGWWVSKADRVARYTAQLLVGMQVFSAGKTIVVRVEGDEVLG